MDLLILLKALVLGIVEGLTEFLPISSTGHLIVVGEAIGFTGEYAETFEIFIQLGAILGVVWYYRARVFDLVVRVYRPEERKLALNLCIAFLPAAVIGFLTHPYIKAYLFSTYTVAWALLVGGMAMLWIERWHQHCSGQVHKLADVTYTNALKVGMAQTLSLFPGVSRAAATIMGGMVVGLSRTTATELSFFLAMPTMFAATLYDLSKSMHALHAEDIAVFGVGFVLSFVTALLVVKTFLIYVSRHTFRPFAWYRMVFGSVILVYLYVW
jgi:undecaprenyl-diphosphatase